MLMMTEQCTKMPQSCVSAVLQVLTNSRRDMKSQKYRTAAGLHGTLIFRQ